MSNATPSSCGTEPRRGPRVRALVAGLLAWTAAAWAYDDRDAAWSPDGNALAFVSDRDGNHHVFVAAADGSGLRQLTTGACDDLAPAWSPEGSGVYFDSDRDGVRDVYFVPLTGGTPRRVFAPAGFANRTPVPSPDGAKLLFESNRERDGLTRLYFTANRGRDVWLLTDTPFASLQAAWSPVGRRIVFRQREDPYSVAAELWVMNDNGTAPRRLTQLGTSAGWPAWSTDGRRVVFAAIAEGNNEIFTVAWDGSDLRRLTHDAAQDRAPRFSPDGRTIVFASNRAGPTRLYLMSDEGGRVRPVLPPDAETAQH